MPMQRLARPFPDPEFSYPAIVRDLDADRQVLRQLSEDADKVEARFEHGVLFVTLPKSEAAKPRRICVNDLVNSPAIQKEQPTELDKPQVTPGLCFTPSRRWPASTA